MDQQNEITPENVKPVLTIEQELAEANRQLAEFRKHGKLHEVEQADGTRKTIDEINSDAQEWLTEHYRSKIESDREAEALRARSSTPYPTPEGERKWGDGRLGEIPILDTTGLQKMFGIAGYKSLTSEQKAFALTIRPSDVKDLDVRLYFGKGSSGRRANDLARKNPAMYKLLRLRAVDEGLIA